MGGNSVQFQDSRTRQVILFDDSRTTDNGSHSTFLDRPISMSTRFAWLLPAVCIGFNLSMRQEGGGQASTAVIRSIVDRASFEFSNESMYRDQKKWIGVTVVFQGSFQLRTDVLTIDKPYQQVRGQNSGGDLVDMIVFADTPVLTSQNYGDMASPQNRGDKRAGVSQGDQVRVFGIVQKCREVITRSGVVKVLPVLDLLLAFRLEDQEFRNPIWVSRDLRR